MENTVLDMVQCKLQQAGPETNFSLTLIHIYVHTYMCVCKCGSNLYVGNWKSNLLYKRPCTVSFGSIRLLVASLTGPLKIPSYTFSGSQPDPKNWWGCYIKI